MPAWRIGAPAAAAEPSLQRRRRIWGSGLLALLLPWLTACSPLGLQATGPTAITIWAENLQIDLGGKTTSQADGLEDQIREYRRVNPSATIVLRRLASSDLLAHLQAHARDGLAPDLLLIRPRHLATLRQRRLLRPLRLSPQAARLFRPGVLAMVQTSPAKDTAGTGAPGPLLDALPYLLYTNLSCYNRDTLPQPPATLGAFIRAGAAGARLALGGTLEQMQWMAASFRGNDTDLLAWIQRANLERSISFVDTDQQLGLGLLEGRFDWIPCSSAWLPQLRSRLGERLGVAPLPAGPAGPANPYLRGRVWAFSAQSSSEQQHLAEEFALFSTNPVQQRNLTLKLLSGLPVSADLPLPLSGYPELAAMQASLNTSQFLHTAALARLLGLSRKAQPLMNRVITGSITPAEGARQLQALEGRQR